MAALANNVRRPEGKEVCPMYIIVSAQRLFSSCTAKQQSLMGSGILTDVPKKETERPLYGIPVEFWHMVTQKCGVRFVMGV